MNDYIYNPVGYKYLETEEGKEELQKEINKFKSISNENFELTEDDYIDLACLSIVSRANFKEQTYQMLNKKLQIAQTLIIFAKALINNSTLTCSVSIKECPQGERIKRDILHKSEIDNQELIWITTLHILCSSEKTANMKSELPSTRWEKEYSFLPNAHQQIKPIDI